MQVADKGAAPDLDGQGLRLAIVQARFNEPVTARLVQACRAELAALGVADEDILVPVVDYGEDYPNGYPSKYGHVNFAQLKRGSITVEGKEIPTTPLTSYTLSLEVAEELKRWILDGRFLLTEAQESIPAR